MLALVVLIYIATVSALAGAHAMNPHSAKRPAALIVRIVNSLWVGAH